METLLHLHVHLSISTYLLLSLSPPVCLNLFHSKVRRLEEQLRSFDQSLKSLQASEDKVQEGHMTPPTWPPDLQWPLTFSFSSSCCCCMTLTWDTDTKNRCTHTPLSDLWPLTCSKTRMLEEELKTVFTSSKSLEAQAEKVGWGLGGLTRWNVCTWRNNWKLKKKHLGRKWRSTETSWITVRFEKIKLWAVCWSADWFWISWS